MAQFCEKVAALDHPQMGFILLRQCCGTCRVVHLMRAMDTKETNALAEAVDKSVMAAALNMLRVPCWWFISSSLVVYFPATFALDSNETMLRTLREAAEFQAGSPLLADTHVRQSFHPCLVIFAGS